jgi:crossover junction endodeoxyribonuclease RuvC
LVVLRNNLVGALKEWKPTEVALESAFMGKNARSALSLGEARGVVIVTVAEKALPLIEIPPALVKRRVAGAGNASKELIAHLVAAQVAHCTEFGSLDESDALAVALCAFLEKSGNIGHDRGSGVPLPPGAELQ